MLLLYSFSCASILYIYNFSLCCSIYVLSCLTYLRCPIAWLLGLACAQITESRTSIFLSEPLFWVIDHFRCFLVNPSACFPAMRCPNNPLSNISWYSRSFHTSTILGVWFSSWVYLWSRIKYFLFLRPFSAKFIAIVSCSIKVQLFLPEKEMHVYWIISWQSYFTFLTDQYNFTLLLVCTIHPHVVSW